jgi:hypothetical protein
MVTSSLFQPLRRYHAEDHAPKIAGGVRAAGVVRDADFFPLPSIGILG